MKLAPGAWRLSGPALVLAIPALFVSFWISFGFILVGLFVVWFYRDPDRHPPTAGIVAPADGKVSVLREQDGRVRLGVFMNVTDVHVNRAPMDGTVRELTHTPGANKPAFSKDSDRNERFRIRFDSWELIMIAGAFARRITPYVAEGHRVTRGDRIGHIAFGSRVDLVFPEEIGWDDVRIGLGDQVRAGETVIASIPTS